MLSIILPTFNESQNIARVIDAILKIQKDCEIVVVDDNSPDGTWCVVEAIQEKYQNVRLLRRTTKRGLSSAVMDGFREAKGDILMALDADGQHDASLIAMMMEKMQNENADVVIGSRYMKGGSVGSWIRDRRIISRIGTRLSQCVSQKKVTDPLGGFFAIKTELYRSIEKKLHPTGFKILLEILGAIEQEITIAEIPLIFRMRRYGESKLSVKVETEFLWQVLRIGLRNIPKKIGKNFIKKQKNDCDQEQKSSEKSVVQKRDTSEKWQRKMNGEKIWKRIEPFMRTIFYGIMIITGAMFIMQWMTILPLYTDRSVQSTIQATMKEVAAKEGWLLSGIEIRSISKNEIEILFSEYGTSKNTSAKRCFIDRHSHTLSCEK